MRQKNIKDIENKLERCPDILIKSPVGRSGRWRAVFPDDAQVLEDVPLYLELGTGKGEFIIESATRDAEGLYLGIEGQPSVIYRAIQKTNGEVPNGNLKFLRAYLTAGTSPDAPFTYDMNEIFAQEELSGLYLNFSDPWPKVRHERRRLTSPDYLNAYARALKSGSFLRFKTDNDNFFTYSRKQIGQHPTFEIEAVTEDLHRSIHAKDNIMTEYERKFTNLRQKINFLLAYKK
ncbi:MAG: tRNA (guanosine(46)-N7)-methyltransferase TrmB [Clostridiales Family XIII bacterium]|jgi:tRNA (guanine-N7-)-methyltransferase|nr:tRNA (guanosine(46)-N7)-methyltransferase TrmB [Clostridiales Family XIII bacterium]